jgi:hypothetical protein
VLREGNRSERTGKSRKSRYAINPVISKNDSNIIIILNAHQVKRSLDKGSMHYLHVKDIKRKTFPS